MNAWLGDRCARSICGTLLVCLAISCLSVRALRAEDLFRKENLVAWCIVPFDSQKRSPAERAEMLERMGIRQLAYDYRAEHIASFDEELDQLAKHNIKLTAWWFPTQLNDEAKLILKVLEKHHVKTQLWVTGSGAATKNAEEQRARVVSEAARIRPIAEAAAKQGCTVALYNHGGWFGEPENQIAIIEELKLDNVGIVYNLHHGHEHVGRLKELMTRMMPYLMAVNLNGMFAEGDKQGLKIVPIGAGPLDQELIRIIRDSGYKGPIGILNHTELDAEKRLLDNLEGLEWINRRLQDATHTSSPPDYRTWDTKTKTPQGLPEKKPTNADSSKKASDPKKFALDGGLLFPARPQFRQFPLTVLAKAKLTDSASYNILVANDTKQSGEHWELFTQANTGELAVYMPGFTPNLITVARMCAMASRMSSHVSCKPTECNCSSMVT